MSKLTYIPFNLSSIHELKVLDNNAIDIYNMVFNKNTKKSNKRCMVELIDYYGISENDIILIDENKDTHIIKHDDL